MLRSHTCGELKISNVGQTVKLSGWVHNRRDHGGIIFIDLRDRYGITQIKFDPSKNKGVWETADTLRSEWVITIEGQVVSRPENTANLKIGTGEIEIEVMEISILNRSKTLPFEIKDTNTEETNEALRLKYRFIDLRRQELQELLELNNFYATMA